uniref:BPTI/Kunitz inhibitor domain-containing protein n=1 Tax=Meloidogyne enterolobii TaxID=390850 RepID=A0A6V7Y9J2_MELEN|nr:unnamed protein product [Meloidogyne enterolobii]
MSNIILHLTNLNVKFILRLFKKRCQKDKDEGNSDCKKPHPTKSWWYVKADKECKSFEYKGCGGNTNRFNSEKLCESICKKK